MSNTGVGFEDFKYVVESGVLYVDKTLFIKDAMIDVSSVTLISRPRRFGKTLNLSTLNYFLTLKDAEENLKLFHGLNITKYTDVIAAHQGKYPVISISLKGFKASSFNDTIKLMRLYLSYIYHGFLYLLSSIKLSAANKEYIQGIIDKTITDKSDLEFALFHLTWYLEKHHGVLPILLIDEYDAPLQESILAKEPYYEEMVAFLSGFLGRALKSNVHLRRAFVTGILDAVQTSIFSGLNNFSVCSVIDKGYAEHFGFTEPEVKNLFEKAKVSYDGDIVKHWYNGYLIGDTTLYNPWSIGKCIQKSGELSGYWLVTGESSVLGTLLSIYLSKNFQIFESLLNDVPIDITIDRRMVLPDISTDENAMWSLLLHTGYLRLHSSEDNGEDITCVVSIPNREVKGAYNRWIRLWLNQISNKAYSAFITYFRQCDFKSFESALNDYLRETASYFDFQKKSPEINYHLFMLGILSGLDASHKILSNREGGLGRYDIALEPLKSNNVGFVIEFKSVDSKDKLSLGADTALNQIKKNNYKAHFSSNVSYPIFGVGMAFFGKSVIVKHEKL